MSFQDQWNGIYGPFGPSSEPIGSSPFVTNPLSVNGQPQNFTGPIIPPGGFGGSTSLQGLSPNVTPGLDPGTSSNIPGASQIQPGPSSSIAGSGGGGSSIPGQCSWYDLGCQLGKATAPVATVWDKLGDWFGRGVVIVLGFIFVGVGLRMFSK